MARILIVEDEPAIAFGLETDLEREGYGVTIATTGDEGLRLADSGAFDLVLLDVMLPGLDGYDVCRELRRRGCRTPVIVLTARTHDAEKVLQGCPVHRAAGEAAIVVAAGYRAPALVTLTEDVGGAGFPLGSSTTPVGPEPRCIFRKRNWLPELRAKAGETAGK